MEKAAQRFYLGGFRIDSSALTSNANGLVLFCLKENAETGRTRPAESGSIKPSGFCSELE